MSLINGVWHDAKLDPPKDGEMVLCVWRMKNGSRIISMSQLRNDDLLYWMPLPKMPDDR